MKRFYARVEDGRAILSKEDSSHLLFSLRAEVGEELEIVDDGLPYEARIVSLSPLEIAVSSLKEERREPTGRLAIFFSPLKNGREEFVLQKGTELGATSFHPYLGERTVVRPGGESAKRKLERYLHIVREAASQCRRELLPSVHEILPLHLALEGAKGKKLYGDEDVSLSGSFLFDEIDDPMSFLVGPEGGISKRERELLREKGWMPVSLGRRILRSETAAVFAAAAFLVKEEGR